MKKLITMMCIAVASISNLQAIDQNNTVTDCLFSLLVMKLQQEADRSYQHLTPIQLARSLNEKTLYNLRAYPKIKK